MTKKPSSMFSEWLWSFIAPDFIMIYANDEYGSNS